jgi:hypothetical protein
MGMFGCGQNKSRTSSRLGGQMSFHRLTLIELDDTFTVCKLGSDAQMPSWATAGQFFSITRTPDELSIVCREGVVPQDVLCERGWRCLRIAGTVPFSVVGVLASLTESLAQAGVGVFVFSTFNTDYLLVKEGDLAKAIEALRQRGHTI